MEGVTVVDIIYIINHIISVIVSEFSKNMISILCGVVALQTFLIYLIIYLYGVNNSNNNFRTV